MKTKRHMGMNLIFVLILSISTLIACNPSNNSPRGASVTASNVAHGNSEFAFDLYHVLRSRPGNVFFSPYSISAALGMTYGGAKGVTEKQIAETMYFLPQAEFHEGMREISNSLKSRNENIDSYNKERAFRLNIANAIWARLGIMLVPEFEQLMIDNYDSEMKLADFATDPEGSRKTINTWVEDQTENRIRDLIPPDRIDSFTCVVLVNAIYFDASWTKPFEGFQTSQEDFYLLDGDKKTVTMMRLYEDIPYMKGNGYQAVQLHYMPKDETSMIIIVPDEGGFEDFEVKLSADHLDTILNGFETYQVSLTMPKFEFNSHFSLSQTLSDMGMPVAFDPPKADFSGMVVGGGVWIDDVIHQADVSVDEEGTVAAAATAVIMTLGAGGGYERVELTIDRPFIFLIHDELTGTVLFMGRVHEPQFTEREKTS